MEKGCRPSPRKQPPNLRAGGEDRSCASCGWGITDGGLCLVYGHPVAPTQVCDSWISLDTEEGVRLPTLEDLGIGEEDL